MDARRFDALVAWAKAVIAHQDDALRPARDYAPPPRTDARTDADNDDRDECSEPDEGGEREEAEGAWFGSRHEHNDPEDVDDEPVQDGGGRVGGVGCWWGAATVLDPVTGEVYDSAQVLVDPVTGQVHPRDQATPRPARRPGRGATALHVTVSAETLLGLSEAPGELTGYGPIPAAMARRLAPGSIMRRLLTDPVSGTLLDYGTSTYAAPADLAAHVLARDGTCRTPGCGRPAAGCDLDHTVPYPDGGTCACNLGARCRHHHGFKTAGVWTVAQHDGVFTIRTATGQRRTVHPADHREALHLMSDKPSDHTASDETASGDTTSETAHEDRDGTAA
jgi:hypothetical protein